MAREEPLLTSVKILILRFLNIRLANRMHVEDLQMYSIFDLIEVCITLPEWDYALIFRAHRDIYTILPSRSLPVSYFEALQADIHHRRQGAILCWNAVSKINHSINFCILSPWTMSMESCTAQEALFSSYFNILRGIHLRQGFNA